MADCTGRDTLVIVTAVVVDVANTVAFIAVSLYSSKWQTAEAMTHWLLQVMLMLMLLLSLLLLFIVLLLSLPYHCTVPSGRGYDTLVVVVL